MSKKIHMIVVTNYKSEDNFHVSQPADTVRSESCCNNCVIKSSPCSFTTQITLHYIRVTLVQLILLRWFHATKQDVKVVTSHFLCFSYDRKPLYYWRIQLSKDRRLTKVVLTQVSHRLFRIDFTHGVFLPTVVESDETEFPNGWAHANCECQQMIDVYLTDGQTKRERRQGI